MAFENEEGRVLVPGFGAFRLPEGADPATGRGHFEGWGIAIDAALRGIGRAPGKYDVTVVLGMVVDVENPGNVVEYTAKLI